MTQEQRTIIITGGNSGMGRAMAEAFAHEGAHIAIIGRDQDTLRETTEALAPHVAWYQADVSQRQLVQTTVANILEQRGHVDVLINAAGFARGVTADIPLEEAEREWDAVIDTNLKGSFLMTVAVGPHLVRPGGRIIYISSIAAFTGGSRAGSAAYAAVLFRPTVLSFEADRITTYWSLRIPMPDIPENSPQVSHDRTYHHRYR